MSTQATPTRPANHALGTLYLVPAPLDFGCDTQVALDRAMPAGTLEIAAGLKHWVCENAKSTRAYLKRIHATHPLRAVLTRAAEIEAACKAVPAAHTAVMERARSIGLAIAGLGGIGAPGGRIA